MKDLGCPFCERPEKYILFRSDNFFITPSVGSFVEGYLLICSKEHFIGMGNIPLNHFDELENLKESVRKVLSKYYIPPIFFEHGPVGKRKRGGCCIDHAHLHAVPLKTSILEKISTHLDFRRIRNLTEVRAQFKREIPYLYYENQAGERYLTELFESIPSQYFRKVVTVEIGKPKEWDWRVHPNPENFERTLEKLRGKFEDKTYN